MTKEGDYDKLREQAEEQLNQEEIEKRIKEETNLESVIEDLKIHQIELELQNEELRATQEQLKGAKDKYYTLYDLAPVGYFTFDRDGVIREVNNAGAEMLNERQELLINKPMMIYLPEESQNKFYQHRSKALSQKEKTACELKMRTKEPKDKVDVRLESKAVADQQTGELYLYSAAIDITSRKKKEKEINKLSRAIEQSPATVVITDNKGNIEYVNPKFTELTGYNFAEVKGKNPQILRSGELPTEFYAELWSTISRGEEWQGEFHNQRKNGELYWERASISPVRNETGKITHYIKVGRDVTERKQLEEELRIKDNAIESSINAIAIANLQGELTYINQSFLQMWDYESKEVIGKSVLEFWHDADEAEKVKTKVVNTGNWVGELVAERKDGTKFNVQMSANLVYDQNGDPERLMASFVDITQRKKSEEKLFNYAQELEKANQKIKTDLQKARKLHRNFLPTEFPNTGDLVFSAYYQPAENLGGDFYNVLEIDDYLIVYLVDVTGHGLDGAMLNIFIRETINSFLLLRYQQNEELSPVKLLKFITDRYQQENFPEDYFLCLLLGVFNKKTMNFKFINAGIQIPPLIIENEGRRSFLFSSTLPISPIIDRANYDFKEEEFNFSKGAALFLTTDGLIEQLKGETMYGMDRPWEIVENNYHLPSEIITDRISSDFNQFVSGEQNTDDVTFLLIKRPTKIINKWEEEIDSEYEAIGRIKDKFIQFCSSYDYDGEKLWIGFQEVLINAIQHGNQQSLTKQVFIRVIVTDKNLQIRIKDKGDGFNWRGKVDKDLDLSRKDEGGRGIILTNMVYDHIVYNQIGNLVLLVKEK